MRLTVPAFDAVTVLVAGDLMLDQYWFGPTDRVSPEAPVPVVRVTASEARAGGAANVGVNLARLGARTIVTGLVGQDAAGAELRGLLEANGIRCSAVAVRARPTITKLRVLSRNQQLIRLDTEDHFAAEDAAALGPVFAEALAVASVCVLSDYGKGTLAEVAALIARCRAAGVPVLVDPKGTDFRRYAGATALTPNLAEFEAVVGPVPDDAALVEKGERLRAELGLGALIVTLSERGMLVVPGDGPAELLPARARKVFDVTGAGDTVIATLTAGLGAGLGLVEAAGLANLAAGLVVGKIGVASVTPSELRLALHEQGRGGRGALARGDAGRLAAEARARGERVVLTNGCFDILHPGHVAYLEEAKTLGDRLIVAVNDDDSVRRLKGEGRPITPLEDRMAVLAGLAAVDWVVPFHEDTPEALVGEILPDVLVKGGDYRPEDIAGAATVLARGGRVASLSYREGRSTSQIVAAIRQRGR